MGPVGRLGNSLGTGSVPSIAAACCLAVAREDRPRLWRWRLLAATFLLWAGAFASIDSLLFMARGAPLLLLLVHDPGTRFERLDAAQGLLFVGIAAVLLFPGIAGAAEDRAGVRDTAVFSYREWMNTGISVVALLLWHVQPNPQGRCFVGRVALLWLGYTVLAAILNRVANVVPVLPGSPLWWPMNVLIAGFVLVTPARPRPAVARAERFHCARYRGRGDAPLRAQHLDGDGAGDRHAHPLAGLAALALYAMRSMLLQVGYVRTLDQL